MSDQGQVFTTFIASELDTERARRTSLDARGVGVVTTSATFTTLLTAVGAIVGTRTTFELPPCTILPLMVTLIALAAAAGLGIIVSLGRLYGVASPKTLEAMVRSRWKTKEIDARNIVGEINIVTLSSLRKGNNRKAALLTAALTCQVAALISLTIAVGLILSATTLSAR